MSKIYFVISVLREIVFDICFTGFGTALTLFYLCCSSIVINTVIVTAGALSRNERGRVAL